MAAVGELLGGHAGRRVVGDQLDDAQRLARPASAPSTTVFARSSPTAVLDRARRRRVDEVAVRARQRHPAVGAAVAEHDLAVTLAVEPGDRGRGGRTGAACAGRSPCRGHAAATWYSSSPSWRLSSCDDTTIGADAVEQRDLEREHRQVAVGEADEPLRPHAHALAGRRPPDQVAGERAVAEVEHPLVRLEVGVAQQQRLVVDVQLHQLGVGDVDDRLTRLGEPERLLGVVDVPRLVEPVDERAVAVRVAALLGVGAHPDVAVGDGEQRLGQPEVGRRRTRARRAATGRSGSGAGRGGRARWRLIAAPRSQQARRGRRRRRRRHWRGAPRGRRPGRRRRPARRRRPGRRRRRRRRPRRRRPRRAATPRRSAAARNRSGAGLPAMCSRRRRATPSATTSKRGARPDASSTSRALRDDETTATVVPSAVEVVEEADRAGVRRDALVAQHRLEHVVLAVARAR